MKSILVIALFPLYQLLAQPTPASLKPEISVSFYRQLGNHAVRLVYRQSDNYFIYASTDGNIYKVPIKDGVPQLEEVLISNSEHDINFLQGMILVGNSLIIVGNYNEMQKKGYGAVRKCTFLSNGGKQWTNMLTTETHASSGTLADHGFSGVCTNLTQDSLFIASGSRTDHGEVKDLAGLYPNLREEPLTTKIFRIPINAQNIYLKNDETALANSGYVYANGFRNEFDMAVNKKGHLFGVENSGGEDLPEEMNWIQQGKHYGFPWRIANTNVLTVYPDPNFPQPPIGVSFIDPISNFGPDANWQRTPKGTSQIKEIKSFTAHRSPLGLIFDNEGTFSVQQRRFLLGFCGSW
jgi:glucose/arabinose dehydrogenase